MDGNADAGEEEAAPADGEGSESPPPREFSVGDKVLAEHRGRIHEAMVKQIELKNKEWRYFVHYVGWSRTWDEWVDMTRLKKYTRLNVMMMHKLNKSQNGEKNAKEWRETRAKSKPSNKNIIDKEGLVATHDKPRNSNEIKISKEGLPTTHDKPKTSNGGKGKKREHDSGVEEKDTRPAKKLVKIRFPSFLRKQLVNDEEFITKHDMLVKLPCNPNVDEILKGYFEFMVKNHTITEGVKEMSQGLHDYFNKVLPVRLLYRNERQQYEEAVKNNVSPSTVYGAEHLLRLFVQLPEFLACVNMKEEALTRLQQSLHDFLEYLQKNQQFFLSHMSRYIIKGGDKEQSS